MQPWLNIGFGPKWKGQRNRLGVRARDPFFRVSERGCTVDFFEYADGLAGNVDLRSTFRPIPTKTTPFFRPIC